MEEKFNKNQDITKLIEEKMLWYKSQYDKFISENKGYIMNGNLIKYNALEDLLKDIKQSENEK